MTKNKALNVLGADIFQLVEAHENKLRNTSKNIDKNESSQSIDRHVPSLSPQGVQGGDGGDKEHDENKPDDPEDGTGGLR